MPRDKSKNISQLQDVESIVEKRIDPARNEKQKISLISYSTMTSKKTCLHYHTNGCDQLSPRGKRYKHCDPKHCKANPANRKKENPYCSGCGTVPCPTQEVPTQEVKENLPPGLKITSCSYWSAK